MSTKAIMVTLTEEEMAGVLLRGTCEDLPNGPESGNRQAGSMELHERIAASRHRHDRLAQSWRNRQAWLERLQPDENWPIEMLKLPRTLVRFLQGHGIDTIGGLVARSEAELLVLRGFGPGKLSQVVASLGEIGCRLGDIQNFTSALARYRAVVAGQEQTVQSLLEVGLSVSEISEWTGLPSNEVSKARKSWMVELREAGESFSKIARKAGGSAEAARRLVSRAGGPTAEELRDRRDALRATQTSELVAAVCREVRSHPGSSVDDIARRLGVKSCEVRSALGRVEKKLVVGFGTRGVVQPTWPRGRLIAVLRLAAAHCTPLTSDAYARLVKTNRIDGPTVKIFYLRFGSWREACDAAGVECGTARRDNYECRWSTANLRGSVVEYLMDPRTDGTLNNFEAWLGLRAGGPSISTMRDRLGTWDQMKAAAIEEICRKGHLGVLFGRNTIDPGARPLADRTKGGLILCSDPTTLIALTERSGL